MPKPPADLPPEANRLRADHLPTPFSAADIRRACAPGRRNVFLIEAAGESHHLIWEFVAADDDGGEGVSEQRSLEGDQLSPPTRDRSTWAELQAHASFPASQTEITPTVIDTPPGAFPAWLYTISDGTTIKEAWFARDLPGPPVRIVTAQDGRQTSAMTLIEFTDPRRLG